MRGLGMALLLVGCRGVDLPDGPDFERMVDQQKPGDYGTNEAVPGRRVMHELPAGSVSRDERAGPEDLLTGIRDGSPVDTFPMPVTEDLIRRGGDRFGIYCAPCHGYLGDGVSVVADNMQLRPAPSLLLDRTVRRKTGQLYAIVTGGYGLMAGYEYQLRLEDRWAVVAWVRALQRASAVRPDDLPEPLQSKAREALQKASP